MMVYLHQASFQFNLNSINLDQILPFFWWKIEQYANQHFTLPTSRKKGNEGIKILLWYAVRNRYKILYIWTIDTFEIVQSVECSDHAKEKISVINHLKFFATLSPICRIKVKQYFILSNGKVVITFQLNAYVSHDH